MAKRYIVRLSQEERQQLEDLVSTGKAAAYKIKHANILLNFVAHMEDVLEIYYLSYDPKRPVICMDEQPVQLVNSTRRQRPALPGQPESVDYSYERNGTANIFLFTEPKA